MMRNIAIVGCGRISANHLRAIQTSEQLKLVGVCDKIYDKASKVGHEYNVPFFTNIEDMLSSLDIDLVSILSESGLHFEHSMLCMKSGRDVLIEKPMALKSEHTKIMIETSKNYGVELFVVKQNRYNPAIIKLREHYEDGGFGRLLLGTVRVRWCRPQSYYDQADWRGTKDLDGGVICNQASHHLDMLLWFMGDVESVFAKSTQALADIEMEDTLVATLKFKSGALGVIEATTAIRPHDIEGSISIAGEKGIAVIGGKAMSKIDTWQFEDDVEYEDLSRLNQNPSSVYGSGHNALYQQLYKSPKKSFLVRGEEAEFTIKLIEALYRSAAIGEEVKMSEID